MESREKGGLNGVKERRKAEWRGWGTEVEEARKSRTRRGKQGERGREAGGEGRMEEGGRRARGHFWKKEAAVETREKGGYGVGAGRGQRKEGKGRNRL